VIESYELAYRMQGVAPRVLDVDSEPEPVRALYGVGEKATDALVAMGIVVALGGGGP